MKIELVSSSLYLVILLTHEDQNYSSSLLEQLFFTKVTEILMRRQFNNILSTANLSKIILENI